MKKAMKWLNENFVGQYSSDATIIDIEIYYSSFGRMSSGTLNVELRKQLKIQSKQIIMKSITRILNILEKQKALKSW